MLRRSTAVAVLFTIGCLGLSAPPASAAEWETMEVLSMPEPGPHWFIVRGRQIASFFDADSGEMQGSIPLSMFSPAVRPQVDAGRIHVYGSYYTRQFYGERTDVVQTFDLKSLKVTDEVEIPAKSAGIGHQGFINLINDRWLGVWNITPAISVSIVDVREQRFVGEISTPGCAGIYPLGDGFLSPCGDGTVQYVALDRRGQERARTRSASFYSVGRDDDDPVYDYAVRGADGWLFVTFRGDVFEVSLDDDEPVVSEGWSILTDEDREAGWTIGGRQPFAYSAAENVLVTVMHQGGRDTHEDAGNQLWGFHVGNRKRGYVVELDDGATASGVLITPDEAPLLLVNMDSGQSVQVRDAVTGRLRHSIPEAGGLLQNF